jgi:predicted DNA-binding protein (MmcQ/YjbR family)
VATTPRFPGVPASVLSKVRRICLALPETTEVTSPAGVDFRIRRRSFAHLFAIADRDGRTPTMVSLRADPDEREVLLAIGHPHFEVRSGVDRVGVVINADTDWAELAELVTESYRLLAPKKLAALVEAPPA